MSVSTQPLETDSPAWNQPPFGDLYTGTAVFLAGLKKGIFTIFAVTFCRIASIVISICNRVPSFECDVSTLASAIIFLSTGDHVVDVAFPTCFSPQYTGTATREA